MASRSGRLKGIAVGYENDRAEVPEPIKCAGTERARAGLQIGRKHLVADVEM